MSTESNRPSTTYKSKEAALAAAKYLLNFTPQVTIQLHPSASGEYMVIYDEADLRNSIPPDNVREEKAETDDPKKPEAVLNFANMVEPSILLAILNGRGDDPEVKLEHKHNYKGHKSVCILSIMNAEHFIKCMYSTLWHFIKDLDFSLNEIKPS